jgi:hypothetical protein
MCWATVGARRVTPGTVFQDAGGNAEAFADLPEALENTLEIAKRCNIEMTLGKNFLPDFPIPPGMTIDEYLVDEAEKGLEVRLVELYPDPEERLKRRPEYDERLVFECKTILQMGFPGYFLIVADFINWAKNNGVPVGPGRGSGAGSLVAYSLRITDLDPLAYALLFERFLNPERVSMPDFDIDFCQDNRWRVIEYVRQHYGADAVSQIATFGTMSSKAVIRDVGRVFGMPYSMCDRISKLIPIVQNKPVSLAEALEQEPQLREMMEGDGDGETIRELFDLASRLEDLTRNVGMHAGGVLIAPGKITDFCPIYQATGSDASTVSQFDKDDVEKVGLVKFDFLGLRNLTIIELAVEYIRRMTGEKLDLMSLGFTDPAAYQILKDANTTAIFQVESEGMKKLLKKLAPDRLKTSSLCSRSIVPARWVPGWSTTSSCGKRPAEDRLFPPRPDRLPVADLRRHRVPGTGDADLADHRRLHAGWRRHAAPGDGQEEARGNGQAPGDHCRRRGQEGLRPGAGRAVVRPDDQVRRVRLQQVAHRRLRRRHLSHRLAQGASLRGLHGGDDVVRSGQHRLGEDLLRRHHRQQGQGARAGRQCFELPV